MDTKTKQLIEKLKEKFPPAANELEADITLTTEEITEMIHQHDSGMDLEKTSITFLLEEAGYHYQAIERNDTIIFAWLLKKN